MAPKVRTRNAVSVRVANEWVFEVPRPSQLKAASEKPALVKKHVDELQLGDWNNEYTLPTRWGTGPIGMGVAELLCEHLDFIMSVMSNHTTHGTAAHRRDFISLIESVSKVTRAVLADPASREPVVPPVVPPVLEPVAPAPVVPPVAEPVAPAPVVPPPVEIPPELEQLLEIFKILPDRTEWVYLIRVNYATHFKVGHFKVDHNRGRRCLMDRYARRATTPNLPSDFCGVFEPRFLSSVKMIPGTVAIERAIHFFLRSKSKQMRLQTSRTEFHHNALLQDALRAATLLGDAMETAGLHESA